MISLDLTSVLLGAMGCAGGFFIAAIIHDQWKARHHNPDPHSRYEICKRRISQGKNRTIGFRRGEGYAKSDGTRAEEDRQT